MGLLFMGTEEVSFYRRSISTWEATAGRFRAEMSRGALRLETSTYAFGKLSAAVTSCWASAQIYHRSALGSAVSTGRFFGVTKGVGVGSTLKGIFLKSDGASPSHIQIVKFNGTTETVLATSVGTVTNNTLHKVDMQVVDYGAAGTVRCYYDGLLVVEYTGDLTIAGVADLDHVGGFGAGGTSGPNVISEVVAHTSDTRGMSVCTHFITGAGTSNTMASGTSADLDEASLTVSDYVAAEVAGQAIRCALSAAPEGYVCAGVKVDAFVVRGATGPSTAEVGITVGGVDRLSAAQAVDLGWDTRSHVLETNPGTGAPFTLEDLDGMELTLVAQA